MSGESERECSADQALSVQSSKSCTEASSSRGVWSTGTATGRSAEEGEKEGPEAPPNKPRTLVGLKADPRDTVHF